MKTHCGLELFVEIVVYIFFLYYFLFFNYFLIKQTFLYEAQVNEFLRLVITEKCVAKDVETGQIMTMTTTVELFR